MMKKFLLIVVCMMLLLSTVVVAETAGTTPDSALWKIDVLFEKISLALTLDHNRRAQKTLDMAEERLAEIQELTGGDDSGALALATQRHEELLSQLEFELEHEGKNEKKDYATQVKLDIQLQQHREKILSFKDELEEDSTLSEKQRNKIKNSLVSLEKKVDSAENKVQKRLVRNHNRLKKILSADELTALDDNKYVSLSVVMQQSAKRAILEAEKYVARLEAQEEERDADETRKKLTDVEPVSLSDRPSKDNVQVIEAPTEEVILLPEDSPLLLDNCVLDMQKRYDGIDIDKAQDLCNDLGRAKDRTGGNLLTGRVTAEYISCVDSDKGINSFDSGWTVNLNYGGTYNNDTCIQNGTTWSVIENYCQNEKDYFVVIPCENGCSDGACLNATSEGEYDVVADGGIYVYSPKEPGCSGDCDYNIYRRTCIDPDADDIYTNSLVSLSLSQFDGSSAGGAASRDSCNGDVLTEQICTGDYGPSRFTTTCENGCDDGACINETTPSVACQRNMDENYDPYTFGYTLNTVAGTTIAFNDSCSGSVLSQAECSSAIGTFTTTFCKYGCESGACVEDTCHNNIQDGYEEGVDCGGACDYTCANQFVGNYTQINISLNETKTFTNFKIELIGLEKDSAIMYVSYLPFDYGSLRVHIALAEGYSQKIPRLGNFEVQVVDILFEDGYVVLDLIAPFNDGTMGVNDLDYCTDSHEGCMNETYGNVSNTTGIIVPIDTTLLCFNGVLDANEERVDCGGICPTPCENDSACSGSTCYGGNETQNETDSSSGLRTLSCGMGEYSYEGTQLEVAKSFLAEAKRMYKKSIEAFRAKEYQDAYDYADCARKLALAVLGIFEDDTTDEDDQCSLNPEICDGADNNCNGEIDENWACIDMCTNGIQDPLEESVDYGVICGNATTNSSIAFSVVNSTNSTNSTFECDEDFDCEINEYCSDLRSCEVLGYNRTN